MVLNFDDLYRLSEEIQQLAGARLYEIYASGEDRYYLGLYNEGLKLNHWLVFDLSPQRPFVVCIKTPPLKVKGKKFSNPVTNFLKAHFLNEKLIGLSVAQKPNRTLLFNFGEEKFLEFKCFPHGQTLILKSEGKVIVFPKRPRGDEEVAFVEPDAVASWDFNSKLADVFLNTESLKQTKLFEETPKQIAKIEKALKSIDKAIESHDTDKILALKAQAEKLKNRGQKIGPELEKIYSEVKRILKKQEKNLQRKAELEKSLENLKLRKTSEAEGVISEETKKKEKDDFKGLKVRLDEQWQLWVGRNALQNDELVRLAQPHELWIHLRDYPGAHGVIRGPKKKNVPDEYVKKSCCIVAQFSQSRKNPFQEGEPLDFVIVERKFVRKPKGFAPGKVIVDRESVRRIVYSAVRFA